MSQKWIYDFVTLFVVLDPVGMLAIFLVVSADLQAGERRKAAILGILYSFGILLFFIIAGELLLIQMGMGVLLCAIATKMVLAAFQGWLSLPPL